MTYAIAILCRAQKELQWLPCADYERLRDAICALADEPRPPGCLALTGRDGWRIRVGNYRVIYEINDTQPASALLSLLAAAHTWRSVAHIACQRHRKMPSGTIRLSPSAEKVAS
jgi:mRNA interferase RelE/StbE